jgi:hypothetical protein
MQYKVRTVYDDGYKSVREFEKMDEAKSIFLNVDAGEIESCFLCEKVDDVWAEVARKEPRKRK